MRIYISLTGTNWFYIYKLEKPIHGSFWKFSNRYSDNSVSSTENKQYVLPPNFEIKGSWYKNMHIQYITKD